jgi:hypothetical protein
MLTSTTNKFKNSVSHFLLFAYDQLKSRAAADGFKEEFENPTIRPANLAANASDKAVNDRRKRQLNWDSVNQKFIKAIKDFTDGTEFEKLVKLSLQNALPHQALNTVRQFIFTKASKKPKILVDEFFATYVIPDHGDPEFDRIYAVDLVNTAEAALSSITAPNNYDLSEEEKGYYLRSLLTPLPRFGQVLSAGQVNANDFTNMNAELQAAIASIAKNKAYGEQSARQSRAQHVDNEVDHANAAQLSVNQVNTTPNSNNGHSYPRPHQRSWTHKHKYMDNKRSNSDYNDRPSLNNNRHRSPTPRPKDRNNYSSFRSRSPLQHSSRSYSKDRDDRRSSSRESTYSDYSRNSRSNNSNQHSNHWRENRNRSNSTDRYNHDPRPGYSYRNRDSNIRHDNHRYNSNYHPTHSSSHNQPHTSHAHAAHSNAQSLHTSLSSPTMTLTPSSSIITPSSHHTNNTPGALSATTSSMFGQHPHDD